MKTVPVLASENFPSPSFTLPSAMRISNADRSLSCGIVSKYEETVKRVRAY